MAGQPSYRALIKEITDEIYDFQGVSPKQDFPVVYQAFGQILTIVGDDHKKLKLAPNKQNMADYLDVPPWTGKNPKTPRKIQRTRSMARTFLFLAPTTKMLELTETYCAQIDVPFVQGRLIFGEFEMDRTEGRLEDKRQYFQFKLKDFLSVGGDNRLLLFYSFFGLITPDLLRIASPLILRITEMINKSVNNGRIILPIAVDDYFEPLPELAKSEWKKNHYFIYEDAALFMANILVLTLQQTQIFEKHLQGALMKEWRAKTISLNKKISWEGLLAAA